MTDKDEIKFAIRYLKQGLKRKRTPPLYEELMKELGFVKKDKVQELEKEIVELKKENNELIDGLGCDTCNIHLQYASLNCEIAELKEKLKPENCLKLLAKGGYIKFTSDNLTKAKEIIKEFMRISTASVEEYEPEFTELIGKAEQFTKELDK